MLGTISANATTGRTAQGHRHTMGLCVGPDDMYLALRGLRTLGGAARAPLSSPGSRSRAGSRSGRKCCGCCIPRCRTIPAMRSGSAISPAPAACSASCSSPCREKAVQAFLDALTLFGIGASWGGFESLAILLRLTTLPHRDDMGTGRTDAALPYRPGRPSRPDRRSGAGLRRARCRAMKQAPSIVAMDALALSRAIKARQVSCVELMNATLDQIAAINPWVNAIVSLQDRDVLLQQASERDAELARGEYRGWMHGFPQAIKDLTRPRACAPRRLAHLQGFRPGQRRDRGRAPASAPAPSLSARPTCRNSGSARKPTTTCSARHATPTI